MIKVTHFTDKPKLGDRLSHNVPLLSCKFSNLQSKISEKKDVSGFYLQEIVAAGVEGYFARDLDFILSSSKS